MNAKPEVKTVVNPQPIEAVVPVKCQPPNAITLQRRICVYPQVKYYRMFVALCFKETTRKSKMATQILKAFFDALPLEKQRELVALFESMTPEQRSTPGIEKL